MELAALQELLAVLVVSRAPPQSTRSPAVAARDLACDTVTDVLLVHAPDSFERLAVYAFTRRFGLSEWKATVLGLGTLDRSLEGSADTGLDTSLSLEAESKQNHELSKLLDRLTHVLFDRPLVQTHLAAFRVTVSDGSSFVLTLFS